MIGLATTRSQSTKILRTEIKRRREMLLNGVVKGQGQEVARG